MARPAAVPVLPAARPETGTTTRPSPMWRVLVHNDDITPMDFVVQVLRDIWSVQMLRALKIMLEAHFTGVALVAVETREQAEFHVDQAHSLARGRGYPLTFSIEPAD